MYSLQAIQTDKMRAQPMLRQLSMIVLVSALALLLISGCATLPENFQRPESYAYTDTDDTRLGKARHDEKLAHPGQSGFYLLGSGLDAFVARAVLAHSAERSMPVVHGSTS
jgi:putative cardiolipin synthase